MQNVKKEPKRGKQNIPEYNNPFDALLFWITLATADFSFGLFEENIDNGLFYFRPGRVSNTAL